MVPKIRILRPPAPETFPRRALTQNRKEKILHFKKLTKMYAIGCDTAGTESWNLMLLDSLGEQGVVTIHDIHRWIKKNNWITSDDSTYDPLRRAERYEHRQGARHFPEQPAGWNIGSNDRNSISPNFSRNQSSNVQLLPEIISPHINQDISQIPLYREFQLPMLTQSQQRAELGSRESDDPQNSADYWKARYQNELEKRHVEDQTSIHSPTPNESSTVQLEITEHDGLYSEEVLETLSTVLKHLAPLNKLLASIECCRALLVPAEKMVTVVQRAQKKCVMALSHKEVLTVATVAKAKQLKEFKKEHLDGQGSTSQTEGFPGANYTRDEITGEPFYVEVLDISNI